MSELLRLDELLALPDDPTTYLVGPQLLPKGGKIFVAAIEKTGKSFMGLNAALCLAMGQNLWGGPFPVAQPVRVLYMDKELGISRLQKRMETIMKSWPAAAAKAPIFFDSKNPNTMLTKEGRYAIIGLCERSRPDVIIYDPISKFYVGFDENNQQHMSVVVDNMDRIAQATGTTAWAFHHMPKPSMTPREGAQRMRGSSVLAADLDTYVEARCLSPRHHKSAILKLEFVTRDEPIAPQYVKRTERGTIEYLGTKDPFHKRTQSEDSTLRETSQKRGENMASANEDEVLSFEEDGLAND